MRRGRGGGCTVCFLLDILYIYIYIMDIVMIVSVESFMVVKFFNRVSHLELTQQVIYLKILKCIVCIIVVMSILRFY